jgi:hypothetical protein
MPGAATFSLATLLVVVTIFAVSLGLELAAEPWGIVAFFLVAPAYMRTARILRRLRENDMPIHRRRDYLTFFSRCCGLSIVTGSAVGIGFYATYWPFAAFAQIDDDPIQFIVNLVLVLAGVFCGMVSGGIVLVLVAVRWWSVREVVDVYLLRHDMGREQD